MKAVVLWLLIATQIAGAQKDYPATFQEWVGKADAEISAVEPSKGCTTNGDCGQNQFCDFVFANGKKEQRQRCFNVPAIVGEVKIGAAIGIGLKLCSSLKDCDEPDACYPLAQEVHDPATNNLFKGVCSKIVVTEDPEEILGEPCEKPNACTEAQFRESKTNHGVRGCKKFEASVFLSKDRGVCLRILVLCPSKLRAGQPEDKDYRHCNGEADEVKNSDIGLVCCAIPYSSALDGVSINYGELIPQDYDKTRTTTLCDNSQSCKADEFCDDSLNFINGEGVKDDSGPNGAPMRFCYKVPIEDFTTYENNEKKFCLKNAECGRGSICEKLDLDEGVQKPFFGICAKAPSNFNNDETTTSFETSTEQPSVQQSGRNGAADSSSAIDDEKNLSSPFVILSAFSFCFLSMIST